MKGKPSAPEPCRQQVVRGPRPEGIPRRGASGSPDTRQLPDIYWMIFRCALSPHTQARPASGSNGGYAYPG